MPSNDVQQQIDDITSEINHITEELRILHLQEAVLKDRLAKRVSRKIVLLEESDRNQAADNFVPIPVPAVVVDLTPPVSPSPTKHKPDLNPLDCNGSLIEVGDGVTFLTKGINTSNTGVVDRITTKYIYCTDSDGTSTKRISKNLRVTDKFYEC